MFVVHCITSAYPCDDDRDGKEDDYTLDVAYMSDHFSWKQWTILALKRQKLLTIALDGLYLICADHKLQVRWDEGRADTLRWHTSA